MTTRPTGSWRAAGFVMPSAIFLIVILAALAAFLVSIAQTQHAASALDLQGARAYQAARAGLEWGLYQVLDPTEASAVAPANPAWPNLPACPAAANLTIEGFAVAVGCASFDYREAGDHRRLRVYQLTATASSGAAATSSRVERQVAATVAKCRSDVGVAPDYACP